LSDGGAPRAAAKEVVDEEDAIGREGGSERVAVLFFVRVEEEVLVRGDTDREEIDRFFFSVESRGMREEVGLIPC
jgi:hypothetical protein